MRTQHEPIKPIQQVRDAINPPKHIVMCQYPAAEYNSSNW